MATIVYMGTPDFAVPALERLIAAHNVLAVVTQPDRPAGRSRQVQQSPVKRAALNAGLPVLQPERIRRPEALEELRQYPADFFVIAAFGQLLPQAVLDMPRHGAINIHASLLPRWRGAAPIQAAIRAGDAETGITIMRMDAGLDTGPILTQRALPLTGMETGASLHDALARLGADLLIDTLPGVLDGSIQPRAQNDAGMTLAPRIAKDDGRIDWNTPAVDIDRTVRAFTPWPGTFTFWEGKLLKILSGEAGAGHTEPGRVVLHDGRLAIGTSAGLYFPARLQIEGRTPAEASAFTRGYPAFPGARLG